HRFIGGHVASPFQVYGLEQCVIEPRPTRRHNRESAKSHPEFDQCWSAPVVTGGGGDAASGCRAAAVFVCSMWHSSLSAGDRRATRRVSSEGTSGACAREVTRAWPRYWITARQ